MTDTWLQIAIEVSAADLPRVEALLQAQGALSLWLEDAADTPVLEPGPGAVVLWPQLRLHALFPASCAVAPLFAELATHLELEQLLSLQSRTVHEQDWDAQWRAALRPLRFGEKLWICPGELPCPDPAAAELRLDPGLAFGTGSHPTTALCLRWLADQPLSGRQVLDFGCGSGILALAALALGADVAIATDNDPQALSATRNNAQRNRLETRLHSCLPGELPAGSYEVIIANILSSTLISLADMLGSRLAANGRLALSGILEEQAEEVIAAWQPWCRLTVTAREQGWVLLSGQGRG